MSSSPQSTSEQVISVLGRPVVLAVANEPHPCNVGNPGSVPAESCTQPSVGPIPVKIYTDETLDEPMRTLIMAIRGGVPGAQVHILRDIMIAKSFWSEDETPTMHIIFTSQVSDGMIVLANKLMVKYGVKNVLFVAYDQSESDRFHLEEVAVWVHATLCNHPTSVKNLTNVLCGIWERAHGPLKYVQDTLRDSFCPNTLKTEYQQPI